MDKEVLRKTARIYKSISEECEFDKKTALYKGVNDLKSIHPVVLIDEVTWHEMNFDGSLSLECEDEFLRGVEQYMKRSIYQWKHFLCDMIATPYIPVCKIINDSGYGLCVNENVVSTDDGNNIVSHEYFDQLESEEDVLKLKLPVISYDEAATLSRFNRLGELIGDIIDIKITGINSYISTWDKISQLCGVTPLLIDLAERPDHSHRIVSKFTDIYLEYIRQYETC